MSKPFEMPEPQGQVADAVRGNWVDHWAPKWSRPYLRLSRADRPIGTWLLLLPCWWGVALAAAGDRATWWDLWVVIGCAMGAFLMRGAGCTWNDITDRKFDAQVARTRSRPIPSGQVTVKEAVAWMILQALIAFMILLTFPKLAIYLGVGSLALVCVYPFAKRFTWWPQVFLGLAFNWGALLAYAAHDGTLSVSAVLMWVAGISWTLFYDTIYAHQDKEDDAMIGVKSTARLFAQNTRSYLRGFMAITTVLMILAVLLELLPAGKSLAAILIALAGIWGFLAHMMWQLIRLNIDDPENCLRLFRSNRDAGLIVALFLACATFA